MYLQHNHQIRRIKAPSTFYSYQFVPRKTVLRKWNGMFAPAGGSCTIRMTTMYFCYMKKCNEKIIAMIMNLEYRNPGVLIVFMRYFQKGFLPFRLLYETNS